VIQTSDDPSSLAEIALLRLRRDHTAPYLLTIDQDDPYPVEARSYGEIGGRAGALAKVLAEAGVSPGSRIGCYLPNGPCWIVASLATWWAGGVVAAVGTLLPGPEAGRLFELADVDTVIAIAGAPALPERFRVITIDEEGLVEGSPTVVPGELPDYLLPGPGDLAAVFFTSGTTGQSKGITYTHADFITAAQRVAGGYARNLAYRPDPAPAHLPPGVIFNPFGHTAGYVRLAFRMWIGRSSVLIPKFTVPAVRALFARFEFDSLQLTPTMIHMLATSPDPLDLSSVKYVTSGTAPLSVATREMFESRFGVPVMQAYGMTEVGTISQERLEDVRAGRRGPGSVGRLATGVELRIRPLDDDRPAGEGEILVRTGELPTEFIGGQRVPVDDEGWFATGDVGRYEDGILYITGRAQEKIIVGGFNVYPAEVEEMIRRSPLVSDVAVVGVPDDRLGEHPVAGVVWSGEPDEEALLDEVRRVLAHYKVPRSTFALEQIPLTPRDKVDRRRVAELARLASQLPDPATA
jgi:acyl-CoA synthetase (AMP-forming)/AMP-acid ligase II